MLTLANKDKFINDGPFWELHPDIWPLVTRYERTEKDHIVESWERGEDGRMHETTKRDELREKLRAAQEALKKVQLEEGLKDE
jgi:hypothetical protein